MKSRFQNLEIVDGAGAEAAPVLELVDTTKEVSEDVSRDEMVAILIDLKAALEDAKFAYDAAEAAFIEQLKADEASRFESSHYVVDLEVGSTYDYDYKTLEKLKPLVSAEKYDAAVKMVPKADKRALNSLAKLGGDVKKLIDLAVISKPKKPVLKIQEKVFNPEINSDDIWEGN